jgi:hypothetical protein
MAKLLLNKGLGGFSFSAAFSKEFSKTYGVELKSLCKDEDGDFGYGIGIRSDYRVVELFEKVGPLSKSSDLELVEIVSLEGVKIIEEDGFEELV